MVDPAGPPPMTRTSHSRRSCISKFVTALARGVLASNAPPAHRSIAQRHQTRRGVGGQQVIAPYRVGWCVAGSSRDHGRQARSRQVRCRRSDVPWRRDLSWRDGVPRRSGIPWCPRRVLSDNELVGQGSRR
jgi:hypothetical protein